MTRYRIVRIIPSHLRNPGQPDKYLGHMSKVYPCRRWAEWRARQMNNRSTTLERFTVEPR